MNAIAWRKNDVKATEGDGRGSVTFLWSAVILTLLFLSIMASKSVERRDSLMQAVPADAIGYVHSNGYPAMMKAIAGPELPPTFAPDEVAVFWLSADDGAPKKNLLVAWRGSELPADEARWIASSPSAIHPIGAGVYLISDEKTVDSVLAARWGEGSLAADDQKRRSLTAARKLLPIQGFMKISAFAGGTDSAQRELVEAGPTMIFGASSRDDGSFVVTIEPLDDAPADGNRGGFVIPPSDPRGVKTVRLPDAPLAFSVPAAQIDPLSILVVAGADDATREYGNDYEGALRQLLTGPFLAAISPNATDKRADFVADFPGIQSVDLAKSLSDYFGGWFPESRKVQLPDGSNFTERYVNADRYGFTVHEGAGRDEAVLSLNIPEAGLSYFLKPDGVNGTIITNNASLLSDRAGKDERPQMAKNSCDKLIRAGASPFISIQKSLLVGEKYQLIHTLSELKLVEFSDNSFVICGYPE